MTHRTASHSESMKQERRYSQCSKISNNGCLPQMPRQTGQILFAILTRPQILQEKGMATACHDKRLKVVERKMAQQYITEIVNFT